MERVTFLGRTSALIRELEKGEKSAHFETQISHRGDRLFNDFWPLTGRGDSELALKSYLTKIGQKLAELQSFASDPFYSLLRQKCRKGWSKLQVFQPKLAKT